MKKTYLPINLSSTQQVLTEHFLYDRHCPTDWKQGTAANKIKQEAGFME